MAALKKVFLCAVLLAATAGFAAAAVPGRIYVEKGQFTVCGKRIWMCGANTPWQNWNDFGGNYNPEFWDRHFAGFNPAGLNSTRVWITCSGEVGINIDDSGHVSGATDKHWKDLDSFFALAEKNGVYVMATLMSFDHFKDKYQGYERWRKWISSDANVDSYIDNYLVPFLKRYGGNNALWSIDLINEPDWSTTGEGGTIEWERHQKFWAKAAKAIHEKSKVLVTVGIGVIKYNSEIKNTNGNMVSDESLYEQVPDKNARLDFYSPHWYSWMDPYWVCLMYETPENLGIGDKPCVVGEISANGSSRGTLTQDYENAFKNGWQGMMPWTSNKVDGNGGWEQVRPASFSFLKKHKAVVLPECHGK